MLLFKVNGIVYNSIHHHLHICKDFYSIKALLMQKALL
jgi:hypothetical protein